MSTIYADENLLPSNTSKTKLHNLLWSESNLPELNLSPKAALAQPAMKGSEQKNKKDKKRTKQSFPNSGTKDYDETLKNAFKSQIENEEKLKKQQDNSIKYIAESVFDPSKKEPFQSGKVKSALGDLSMWQLENILNVASNQVVELRKKRLDEKIKKLQTKKTT